VAPALAEVNWVFPLQSAVPVCARCARGRTLRQMAAVSCMYADMYVLAFEAGRSAPHRS
jgi:hypothetical protein